MKIKMIRNPSLSYGCELMEGETGDVSNDLGESLVAANIAIEVHGELRGVPNEPSIAVPKPASIKGKNKQSKSND